MPNILQPAMGSQVQTLFGLGAPKSMPSGGLIMPNTIQPFIPGQKVPIGKSGDFNTRDTALQTLIETNGRTVDQDTSKAKVTAAYAANARVSIVFDSQERCNMLAPADPTWLYTTGSPKILTDNSGIGGVQRTFGRVYSSGLVPDESPWFFMNLPFLGNGTYRWLCRNAGVAAAAANSTGPEPMFRAKVGLVANVMNVIQAYSTGPMAYAGTQRQRIRRLANGVITDLNPTSVSPIVSFNQWFWHQTEIIGSTIKVVLYDEAAVIPAYLYTASDATFAAEAGTKNGIGFRRSVQVGAQFDVAKFEYIAAP